MLIAKLPKLKGKLMSTRLTSPISEADVSGWRTLLASKLMSCWLVIFLLSSKAGKPTKFDLKF